MKEKLDITFSSELNQSVQGVQPSSKQNLMNEK